MKARSVGTFVQIGNLAINMALVIKIGFSVPGAVPSSVWLYFIPGQHGKPVGKPVVLTGENCAAFLDWWEREATRLQYKVCAP